MCGILEISKNGIADCHLNLQCLFRYILSNPYRRDDVSSKEPWFITFISVGGLYFTTFALTTHTLNIDSGSVNLI